MIKYIQVYKKIFEAQSQVLKSNSAFFRLIEWSKQSLINTSWAQIAFKLFFSIVLFIIKGTYLLLMTIYEFATSSITKFIRVTSMILTLWLISSWIYIITEKTREIDEYGDTAQDDIFGILYSIKNNFERYSILWSMNILCLFIILIKQLSFSSSLSLFNEVIKRITFDAVFFIILFINITIVFSFIINILFGITDEDFSTVSNSLLNSFLIMLGEKSSQDIVTFNTNIRNIFCAIFMILMILLLNMFVAIIGSHYFEYYTEIGDAKFNSIKLFINSILGDQDKLVYKSNQSWFIKSKNAVFRFLYSWVNQTAQNDVLQDFKDSQQIKKFTKSMNQLDRAINL